MEPSDKKLMLPRPHLSWSAMDLWNKNPDRFKREYFEGAKRLDTKYLQFGKSIAKSIEDGTHKDILPNLHVYSHVEYEIKVTVRGVPLLCFLDSCDPVEILFDEYKTGKNPWDQAKVQKHGQLTYYAMALRASLGRMPEYCDLHWIETTEQPQGDDFWSRADSKLKITGKVKTFRRNFDIREIERMEEEVERVAWEISKAYEEFLNKI